MSSDFRQLGWLSMAHILASVSKVSSMGEADGASASDLIIRNATVPPPIERTEDNRAFQVSLDIDRTDDIDQLNDFVERYDLVNTLGANVSVWFSDNMFRARYKDDAEVFVDFQSDSLSWRRLKGGGEALVRAIGANRRSMAFKKKLYILDATGGFGTDAYILASHGMRVRIYEKHPVVAALLEDGIRRMNYDEGQNLNCTDFMDFRFENSCREISRLAFLLRKKHESNHCMIRESQNFSIPDVIYLDPMFPRKKQKSLPKKHMKFLQDLTGPDEQNDRQLLHSALNVASKRVVVKRPMKAPPLGHFKTRTSVPGGDFRFDIYSTLIRKSTT